MSNLPVTAWRRALVTGASSGIGAAIARRLAADGVDVVLVARRLDRIEELAASLRSATTNVEVLAADLCDPADLGRVVARVTADDAPIDLLVNNAGLGSFGRFWDLDIGDERAQIDLNVGALVSLTHAALGHMVPAGRGAVMNVSSVAGNQPGPGNATYGATKAFVTLFTEALAIELRGTGVEITVVCPGLTRTEFHTVAGVDTRMSRTPRFLWMSADAVAAEALEATAKGKVVHVTGLGNRVLAGLSTVAPRGLRRRVAGAVIGRVRPT